MHKPSWYKDNEILIVNAKTCGINKDGHEQYVVDPETGDRSNDQINDTLGEACEQIKNGIYDNEEVLYCDEEIVVAKDIFVPKYYDKSVNEELEELLSSKEFLSSKTLGELIELEYISLTRGHGSPSSDQRLGEIPYIKVSDLRAGSVNINPTNMVPLALARQHWRGETSGLRSYDLLSPERASKNIGEFCVLMPGQENVVLTKEIIVMRATDLAPFDQFYLMWALSLTAVRKQWDRIVFMQTNREDVGKRVLEIRIPFPLISERADEISVPFKEYYTSIEAARRGFINQLNSSEFNYHIHLGE